MKRDYASINWDEWFVYDENAYPSCLRWKVETKLKSRSICNTYVVVTWTEEGKSQQKTFSVIQLGLLPAFAEAVKYRDYKIQQLNSQGYGYTDRHLQKENNYD